MKLSLYARRNNFEFKGQYDIGCIDNMLHMETPCNKGVWIQVLNDKNICLRAHFQFQYYASWSSIR